MPTGDPVYATALTPDPSASHTSVVDEMYVLCAMCGNNRSTNRFIAADLRQFIRGTGRLYGLRETFLAESEGEIEGGVSVRTIAQGATGSGRSSLRPY